jgi:hypothetical protein
MVGSYKWEMKVVNSDSECLILNGERCFGITDCANLIIYIVGDGIDNQIIKTTIIHELTHAYLFSLGIRADAFDEEDICYFVEANAWAILNQSQKLYHILFDKEVNYEAN